MAVVKKQVDTCEELDSLLAVVVGIVTDLVAKKDAGVVVQDAVPALVKALSGLGQLDAELKSSAVVSTIALKLVELAKAVGV